MIIDMEKLLTLEQAAVDLPVTAVTLRKYCLRGQIGLKLGDRWFLTNCRHCKGAGDTEGGTQGRKTQKIGAIRYRFQH